MSVFGDVCDGYIQGWVYLGMCVMSVSGNAFDDYLGMSVSSVYVCVTSIGAVMAVLIVFVSLVVSCHASTVGTTLLL